MSSENRICPDCYSELVSEYRYPYKGKTYVSHYCIPCDRWVPKPLLSASRWNPRIGDYKENVDTSVPRVK